MPKRHHTKPLTLNKISAERLEAALTIFAEAEAFTKS